MNSIAENPHKINENEFLTTRRCSGKRSMETEFFAACCADYFSRIYDKPFDYYSCDCGGFHLFTVKNK